MYDRAVPPYYDVAEPEAERRVPGAARLPWHAASLASWARDRTTWTKQMVILPEPDAPASPT